uniref:Ty3 transposon capsid-like protein domain-containing protein n=1 Tax=Oryzias latipes TaxID=8090 RepID=A0A3B3HMU7_ORYLA
MSVVDGRLQPTVLCSMWLPPLPHRQRRNFRLRPEPFHGVVEHCSVFLLQCQLIFQQAPRFYQSDHSKITLIVNSLRHKAMQWAQAYLTGNPISHLSFIRFIEEFKTVFDQPRKEDEATHRLLNLRQCI